MTYHGVGEELTNVICITTSVTKSIWYQTIKQPGKQLPGLIGLYQRLEEGLWDTLWQIIQYTVIQ